MKVEVIEPKVVERPPRVVRVDLSEDEVKDVQQILLRIYWDSIHPLHQTASKLYNTLADTTHIEGWEEAPSSKSDEEECCSEPKATNLIFEGGSRD
jgi:hypothetical protein